MHAPNTKIKTTLAHEQSDLLQSLLENLPDIVYFKDLESRFILINHAAAKFFKLASPLDAIGKTDFEIFAKEHARQAFEDEQEIIRTGNPIVGKEEKETWPDGSVTWATTTKMPLRNKSGQIIGTFGVSRDITERIRAMQQIAEQAALIDIAPDAFIVTDLESKILFWSKGAEHTYGWTSQEALGKCATDLLFLKENRPKNAEVLNAVLAHGTWSGELHHVTKDNRNLIIESQRTLIGNSEGKPTSLLVINTDVTEKRKIEAQFMRAQRMESIGVLAGGIAHDLNNILSPILMSINLLQVTAGDLEKEILNSLEASAKRGASIVKQVLSFARGIEGEHSEIHLLHLLKEMEQIIKDTFPKNIDLHFPRPQELWTIMGDPTQLHQVLLNLCVNARDAMSNGGRLTIATENRFVDEQFVALHPQAKVGPHVLLSVTDTGMGIPPEVLDKIFEPFFTTKDSGKGTGLGLSTTMGIVKSHGGFITVYSDPGKGTTFRVYLPAETSCKAPNQVARTTNLARGHGETILVVDDESGILSVSQSILTNFGYKVHTATNGAEAIAVYLRHQNEIAVIITDLAMPVMDGLSAINIIKKINSKVKVIASSGLFDETSLAKAASVGIRHFLNKPCSTEEMLGSLRELIDEPDFVTSGTRRN